MSSTLDFNVYSQIRNIKCDIQAKLKLKVKVKFTQLSVGRENNSEPIDLLDEGDINIS